MVYQTLSSLFILSNRIKKLKKTLKNKEEWKNISEIFINQCNEFLNLSKILKLMIKVKKNYLKKNQGKN